MQTIVDALLILTMLTILLAYSVMITPSLNLFDTSREDLYRTTIRLINVLKAASIIDLERTYFIPLTIPLDHRIKLFNYTILVWGPLMDKNMAEDINRTVYYSNDDLFVSKVVFTESNNTLSISLNTSIAASILGEILLDPRTVALKINNNGSLVITLFSSS